MVLNTGLRPSIDNQTLTQSASFTHQKLTNVINHTVCQCGSIQFLFKTISSDSQTNDTWLPWKLFGKSIM